MDSSTMVPIIEDNKKATRTVLLVVHVIAFLLGLVVLICVATMGDSSSSGRAWLIVITIVFLLIMAFGFAGLFYRHPTLLKIYAIVLCFFIAVILISILMSSSGIEVLLLLIMIAMAAVVAFFAYTLASHYEALQMAATLPPSSPPSQIVTISKSPVQPAAKSSSGQSGGKSLIQSAGKSPAASAELAH